MSETTEFRFLSAGVSHTGRVRTENQDAFLDRPDLGLWAVADGMGGHHDGAMASAAIVESLDEVTPGAEPRDLLAEVKARLEEVNSLLLETAGARGANVTIASTVVVLMVHGRHFACAWAGDSRLYLMRAGAFTQVTRDHSEVQDLIDGGMLTAEAAASHPANNVVTRAVGATEIMEVETTHGRLYPGDTFLLSSDGLTKMMTDAEIAGLLPDRPVENAAQALIDETLERGATDNVTVVVIRCEDA